MCEIFELFQRLTEKKQSTARINGAKLPQRTVTIIALFQVEITRKNWQKVCRLFRRFNTCISAFY